MATVTKAANAQTAVVGGWNSPSSAFATAADGAFAGATPGKNATVSGDFAFPDFTSTDIPDGSTINSVTINTDWKMSASVTGGTLGLQLYRSGVAQGTETTKTTITEEAGTQQVTSGISLSDLRSASIVLAARARCSKGNTNTAMTGGLDFVSLTVDYTAPAADDGLVSVLAEPRPTAVRAGRF